MLKPDDLLQLKSKNLTEEQVERQLDYFMTGFPYLKIKSFASVGKGILRLTDEELNGYIAIWNEYLNGNGEIAKFVPASGAASRMFKDLYAFLSAPYDVPQTDAEKTFFENIEKFAFYEALNETCRANEGCDIPALKAKGHYKAIAAALLERKGLNYGALPKGLFPFHRCPKNGGVRTAMEEHLVDGAVYARVGKQATVHFTVLPEHLPLFRKFVEEKIPEYEKLYGVQYDVSFSMQQPDTDTIAVDRANMPFRDGKGRLVFRPGGHGALIQNLNRLKADIVFITNIDNVTSDHWKPLMLLFKKALAGVLISFQRQIFDYVRLIESGSYTHEQIEEMIYFLQNQLYIKNPEIKYLEDVELVLYMKRKLMRPLRVCGMVQNAGEPGGGPFLVMNADGTISPQILESSQIDRTDASAKKAFEESTHFNPVDLVCALKDVHGNPYNLPDFADRNTGFISQKSKDGRELKALELPGLWNGAMSDWNTVFVEVPIKTFNPVKTVNDLLHPRHLE